jgi:LPXTG-motif cell wall-anchored protein
MHTLPRSFRSRCTAAAAAGSALASVLLFTPTHAGAAPAPAEPQVYVATQGKSPDLAVISPSSMTVTATRATDHSGEVAFSADGRTAYATESNGNDVAVVDTDSGEVVKRVPVASSPTGVAVNPVSGMIYVDRTDANRESMSVTAIDPSSSFATSSTKLDCAVQCQALNLAVSPDGKTVYLADGFGTVRTLDGKTLAEGKSVVLIDAATANVLDTSEVYDLSVSPDGKTLYAADFGHPATKKVTTSDGGIFVINTSTVTADGMPIQAPHPLALAMAPDGTHLYVASDPTDADLTAASIRTVDLTGNAQSVSAPIASIKGVGFLAMSPDGRTLFRARSAYRNNGHPPFDAETEAFTTSGQSLGAAPGGDSRQVILAVTPDQAPVAKLRVAASAAGAATTFDASASTVKFGTIASYRWDFGDGTAAVTTDKPTVSHTYAKGATFTATVTETDSAGTSTTVVSTGRAILRNGGPSAVATSQVTVAVGSGSGSGSGSASGGSGSGPASSPAHTGAADSGRHLAHTGSSVTGPSLLGAACLLVGAALVLLARQRRARARHAR